jgi:3-oxoacyl-[acyl-carrier-protein] synthase-3
VPRHRILESVRFTIGIVGLGSYLPGSELGLDAFGGGNGTAAARSPLLAPPQTRHHVRRDETASAMVENAARPMFERLGVDPAGNVDLLITNTLLPDTPITGCGAEAAHVLGCKPGWIVDLHNGGCGSFAYMLKLAQAIISSGDARSALLCNVQNTAGQLFTQPQARATPQSVVPGDGCGVAYVTAGKGSPVLGVETRNEPAYAKDMGLRLVDERKYWEPGTSEMSVSFANGKQREIVERGNQLVPEVVHGLCRRIGVRPGDIDVLITNQPNRLYLRNWRRALDIDGGRHIDTFDKLGNLYGAALPVTLEHAARTGAMGDGDLVVLGGFAHAGDFAAAAALRWRAQHQS